MSASPKSKRTPDERRMFEDYVLTKEVSTGAGLYPLPNEKLQDIPLGTEFTPGTGPSAEGIVGEGEATLPLNFNFRFDGLNYTRVHVTASGMVVLLEQSRNTFTSTLDYNSFMAINDQSRNSSIKTTLWTYNDVVLAPWWDLIRSTWRTTAGSRAGDNAVDYLTELGLTKSNVDAGASPCPSGIDPSGGVKYYSGLDANGTKMMLIRWKTFTGEATSQLGIIISFEVVLYENGVIEFRYAPKIFDRFVEDFSSATVGIFASGPSFYALRYRDASPLLSRKTDSRGIFMNGGAVYDGVYNDPVYSKTYTVSLRAYHRPVSLDPVSAYSNWPAAESAGAILRFSPPRLRRKQNKSIVQLRDSTPFVGRDQESFFDDQLSIPFTVQSIQYPTMLPDTFRVSVNTTDSAAINELFTSSSISVERTVTPGLFDSVLSDAIIEGRKKRSE